MPCLVWLLCSLLFSPTCHSFSFSTHVQNWHLHLGTAMLLLSNPRLHYYMVLVPHCMHNLFPWAVKWTMCHFTFLTKQIQHSSIMVYLSVVGALHIEQQCQDALANGLCLKRMSVVLSSVRAPSLQARLPITDDLILDHCLLNHCMFWTASSLGYFGYLCASDLPEPNVLFSVTPSRCFRHCSGLPH